ncbi:MAG: hypothetical protein ACE5KI_08750 [Dehalococcoidia bacterium]
MERFEREVDVEAVWSKEERQRRVEAARKAHMARLSLKPAEKQSGAMEGVLGYGPTDFKRSFNDIHVISGIWRPRRLRSSE